MSGKLRLTRTDAGVVLCLKKQMMQTTRTPLSGWLSIIVLGALISAAPAKAQSMPDNQLVLPAGTFSIPFCWQGDSIHSKWEPHSAILVPVKLAGCPRLFYMQFDLGSSYSLFYKNKLAAIQRKYPGIIPQDEPGGKLMNFPFEAGQVPIAAKEIAVKQFDSSTIDWDNKSSVEIIGTIGADLIDGRVIVIDYPLCKLTISQAIPAELMPDLSLADFTYAGRSVLLPVTLRDKQTLLYFDTGSSMYGLLTDKNTCRQLAIPDAELIQYKVRSWDRFLTANSLATNDSLEIAGAKIPIHYSTYIEGASSAQVAQMLKMGIGGMTGNKIFLGYKLVLDTKHKKFGLIRSE